MKLKFAFFICIMFFFNNEINSQWILLQNIGSGRISDIEIHNNFQFAASESSGVFRSSDNGASWVAVNSGLSSTYVTCLAANSFGIFASTSSGVFSSTNDGNNWNITGSGISGGLIRKVTSVNNNIYAGHILAGVFRTTNNGVNWQRFALGEGDKLFTLYGTQSEFYISVANTILRTTNNGLTFNSAIKGLSNLSVMTLSSFENDLYAGSRNGIFYSTNIGFNWIRVADGLNDSVFNVIINKGINVFAGSRNQGIFLSTNRGQLWTSINSGLTDTDITSIAASQEYLFAGSSNGKLWRRNLNELPLSIIQNEMIFSKDFNLHGNFPNPFNPETKIQFSVIKNSNLSLYVFDANGREVVRLLNNKQYSAGDYSVTLNASQYNLTSGVYFYKLAADNFSDVKKMMLIK